MRDAGGPFAHLAAHNVALGGVTENNTTRQAMIDIVTHRLLRDAGRAAGLRPRLHARRGASRHAGAARSSSATSCWERCRFDRDILKQTVRLNGQDFGIVGVAPERFSGTTAIIGTEYFVPLGVHDAIENDFDSTRSLPDLRSPQPLR